MKELLPQLIAETTSYKPSFYLCFSISTQQEQDELSERRSTEFFESTKQQIIELSSEDYPKFSIRNLLELIQLSLKRFEFPDPWHEKKRQENGGALSEFQRRLGEVDEISDAEAKWTELVKGVLAGEGEKPSMWSLKQFVAQYR